MRVRLLLIKLITRVVERIASSVSHVQTLLYGLLPALLTPEELTGLVHTYYTRSYESLVDRFDATAHSWTLENWEEGVASRHMAILGTVVVLGAGLGRESLIFARRGHRVIGIDNTAHGPLIATRRASEQRVGAAFVQADFQRLPFHPLKADYIFMSGVMYSAIPGRKLRQDCLRHYRELVASNGKIILNFVRSHGLPIRAGQAIHRLNRWLLKLPGSNPAYQPGDLCSHEHFMHAFLNEAELRSELTEAGTRILELNWQEGFVVLS